MSRTSNLANNYPRSGIRIMFELAAQYDNLINLCIGEPNFDTPNYITESAKKALDAGYTHYESNAGITELRQAIADKYKRQYGYECTIENVQVTIGGTEANFLTLISTINPGDEVIVTNPCYINYVGQIMTAHGKQVNVPIYEENEFKLQPGDLEKAITPKTKIMILNSPNNPVGFALTKEDIEAIAEVVHKHNLLVISDEAYEKLYYDGRKHYSISQIPEVRKNIIVTNTLSKTYAMTGWRIGYIVGDKEIIQTMPFIQEGIVSCAPAFIQQAAVDAITGPQSDTEQMVKDYTRRRNIFIDGLNSIPGFKCIKSPGAFYAWPNIKSFGKTSEDFAIELLKEAGVVATPGSAFGSNGEGYMRFCFANSDENLKEAVRRIKEHVKKNY
jgi:aminotransferase